MSNPTLDRIVSVTITPTTKVPTEQGFNTPCVAAYHSHYADRMRQYDDTDGMVSDGFRIDEPGYLAAAAIFAQGLHPVKIGRRASSWTQLVDLTPTAGVYTAGIIYTATVAGSVVQRTSAGVSLAAECTAIAAAINALQALAVDVDAIIATGASSASPQTYAGSLLDGVIGGGSMVPGRFISFTFSSNADWDATDATLTGIDDNGVQRTETISIPNGGGTTVNSTRKYTRIISFAIPAQSGTGGTFTAGVRARATADGSSGTKVRVTAAFAADLIPYAIHSSDSNLQLADATADPGLDADLTAIKTADPDFYGLTLDSNSPAEVKIAAAWAETNGGVIYTAQTADSATSDTTVTADTTSVAAYLKSHSYFRSVLFFHPTIGTDFIAGAILGSRLLVRPGSDTWAYKTLAGISTYGITSTQDANLRNKNVNRYLSVDDIAITLDGKVAAGEFADVIRFRDWLIADIQVSVFGALVNNEKIPYTNPGAQIVAGAIRASLRRGVEAGGLTDDPKPTVTVPDTRTLSPTQRQSRLLPNVKFAAQLAGAVHAVQILGEVTA